MYLPVEVLIEALRDIAQVELHCSKREPIAGVRLHGSPIEAHYAYVIRGEAAKEAEEARFLICIGKPVSTPERYILLPDDMDPLQVLCVLQDCFLDLAQFETRLARAAAEEGYEPLMDLAARRFGNSVVLFDSSNRVRAAARIPTRAEDANSFESLRRLRRNGDLDYISGLREPTECNFPYFGASCVITNLFVDDQPVGRLLVICHLKQPDAQTRYFCAILAEFLQNKIVQDPAFGMIRADDPLYSMFYDLFSGLRLASEMVRDRLRALPGWENGAYRVLSIELADDAVSFEYCSSELGKQFDSFCVLRDQTLLCVIHAPDEAAAWALEPRLEVFLHQIEQRGGLSNVFSRFEQMHDRAEQAQTALRFSDGETLSVYARKMLRHMLTFFPREQRYLLIHPAIFRLRAIDREQGTAYSETLCAYLRAERSPAAAAAQLFIHRNTLLYRLEHLREIVSLDLEDPAQRLQLLLSYELLEESAQPESE